MKREVEDRKALFAELNSFVRSRNGWITSIPGDIDVTVETLPGSTLPDELRSAGHDVQVDDPPEGQRILPTAITEQLEQRDDGSLGPVTAGSTRPVALVTTHAGIVRVERFRFAL